MIGSSVGRIEEINGRSLARSEPGVAGHLVFGPYDLVSPGVYRVDFDLALIGEASIDELAAVLDVAGDEGRMEFARLAIRTSDLSHDLRRFSLLFETRGLHFLEFRVFASGRAELVSVPSPALTRVSGTLDVVPDPNLGDLAQDLSAFARDTRRILRPLSPMTLTGVSKVRLGRDADGGYTCPNDFKNVDTAFSFGINDDISWDLDVADRGITIYQFDHTVEDPAPDDVRMHFTAKMIAPSTSATSQSLSDLIRLHDRGHALPNIILKMDIEGAEWEVIDATPEHELARIRWIVCELHYLQGLAERTYRDTIDGALGTIGRHFAAVHIHSNVYGGYSSFANTIVPNVLEVTFVNRACYALSPNGQTYPADLDQSCDPAQPDFYLGAFQF